jgi:hypothetical protein
MSVAVIDRTLNLDARDVDVAKVAVVDLNPRTRVLLHGPIVPTLLLMAWPNVLVMFAQAATGLIETWLAAVVVLAFSALAFGLFLHGAVLLAAIASGAGLCHSPRGSQ